MSRSDSNKHVTKQTASQYVIGLKQSACLCTS